jgi:hypothetical protein
VAREAELVERIQLPVRTRKALHACRAKRDRLTKAQAELLEESRRAAVELTRSIGISLRDAGELLGLSQERVRQLLELSTFLWWMPTPPSGLPAAPAAHAGPSLMPCARRLRKLSRHAPVMGGASRASRVRLA